MKTIMNKKFLTITCLALFLSSCGSNEDANKETTFYKKETVNQKN